MSEGPRLRRPIFVIGPPRCGAEAVVAALTRSADAAVLDGGHPLAAAPRLLPEARGWDTSRLGIQDARPGPVRQLEAAWNVPPDCRLVATWPEAALQVRFLHQAWPDALFVYVHRDPVDALAESAAAWAAAAGDGGPDGPDLPGWAGPAWTGPLTPEWRSLAGRTPAEIAADQWRRTVETAIDDLERIPATSWTGVSFHDLVADPVATTLRLAAHLVLAAPPADDRLLEVAGSEPVGRVPDLDGVLPTVAAAAQRAREALEHAPTASGVRARESRASYGSEATPNVAELLRLLGSSLAVSTYQTGRLVLLREQEGALNTHFRALDKPMGIAHRPGALTVGTRTEVVGFRDVPGLKERVGAAHDAVFVPRTSWQTGDIRIHDLAWVGEELWAVSTRFSCLVTFDGIHSFVPRWKPRFVTALAPEDRCHLNGLAVVDGRVKYVTALGTTDTAGGWRLRKADGGVVIDVETDEILVDGLAMPHSPRWYRDRLWVLESGQGGLVRIDPSSGDRVTVAELPGFTRGIAFAGRYAFVGLSQVREATTFGGIPLTGRLEDRQCGVWVVDIETGETMGFVRFEDRVEEIFDVALLSGLRFPELLEPGHPELVNAFVLPPGGTATAPLV